MSNVISRFLGTSVAATLVATLAAALVVALPTAASAATATVGDLVYSYEAGNIAAGAEVADYLGASTAVTIPGTVTIGADTYDVKTIGLQAFESNGLTAVTIPNSVTSIGLFAFKDNDLTAVTIPNSVTSIGNFAFYLNDLTSLTIPNSVTTIGMYAFADSALTSLTIPNSVTTIGDAAFEDNSLTSVTLPDSVISIGHYAFYNNDLTSVTIPSSVTVIGASAYGENPLVSVLMQGPVPSTIGLRPFGVKGATTPLVTFLSEYAWSGYTTPTWFAGGQEYASQVSAGSSPANRIVTMTPTRIADLGTVTAGVVRCVAVVGQAGIPNEAVGVILNVTTAGPVGGGNVVVYPDHEGNGASAPPAASTVNFEKASDVANAAFVALPANGDVCTFSQGSTLSRLILDVTGYILPGSGITLQNSQRLMDTRGGTFPTMQAGPVQPNDIRTIQVTGNVGVPAGATAVLVNVTVTDVAAPGHLRMWAAGAARPNTSVLNYAVGKDKANAQIVALSADGKISFESISDGSAQVIVDVVGYVSGSTQYVATVPTRIVETRLKFGVVGPIGHSLGPDQTYGVVLSDTSLVPTGATAVVLNVTAVQPDGLGHIKVYPDSDGSGSTHAPNASTLNYIPGRDIPNLVVVQLPANRSIAFNNIIVRYGRTDLVVDVVGYVYGGG